MGSRELKKFELYLYKHFLIWAVGHIGLMVLLIRTGWSFHAGNMGSTSVGDANLIMS